jgi:hypothetical protein
MANPRLKAALAKLLSERLCRIESMIGANQTEVLTIFSHFKSLFIITT